MLILFDYGHGGKDPGAVYKSRREADDVLAIGQAVAQYLRTAGITVDETRVDDRTMSLQQRVQMEHQKNYDFFISFHRNAFKPEHAQGVEIYVYTSRNTKSKALAHKLLQAFVSTGFKNRGVKTANFFVLKHTKAPALLLEIGFIDHSNDNKLFDTQFQRIAQTIAQTIIEHVQPHKTSNICTTCGKTLLSN